MSRSTAWLSGALMVVVSTAALADEPAIAPIPYDAYDASEATETSARPIIGDREIEVINERYDSGAIRVRREVTMDAKGNYVRHGVWQNWDESGTMLAQGAFREDVRNGEWMRMYRTRNEAQLFTTAPFNAFRMPFLSNASFTNGKLDGKWIIQDADKRTISEWNYVDGRREGVSTWYFPNGQKMTEIVYRDGVIHGSRRQFDQQASLVLDEIYESGRKLAVKTEFFTNRRTVKKSEGMYLHARHVIETEDDWWKAIPVAYTTEGKDERHGGWISWHQNGKKETEGEYEHDKRIGKFNWWYPNGQLRVEGAYDRGVPSGTWVWFHQNGQKATHGGYTKGEPSGPWAFWGQDGRLTQKVDFTADKTPNVVSKPDEESDDYGDIFDLSDEVR